jgi:hypothetical protein
MAVTMFAGLMGGAILGYATQNGRSSICTYLLEHHPNILKSAGVILFLILILIPTAVLTGVLAIDPTPFFWGGVMACSFVYGFFATHCLILQNVQEA